LCHPGSCPECPANRKIECFCGKKDFVIRCSDKIDSKSCGEICGKKLNCGKHTCDSICHEGDCKPCPITSKQKCYCGKEEGIKPCLNTVTQKENGEDRTFSCKKVCGKKLKCGNHTCELPCHSGSCHSCHYSVSNVKTCPCGKSKLGKERKSCLDAIPTCDNQCKKKLPCGIHSCSKKCHLGDCGHCVELIGMSCRCGSTSSKIPCALTYLDPSDPFVEKLKEEYKIQFPILCDKVCNTTKNCVRHKCKTVCCPSKHSEFDVQGNHICHQTCGRKLNCGKHSCDLPCHGLNCQPCAHIIRHRLVCKCGKTHIDPPQHCGVKLPQCDHPCSIKRKCGHAVKHNCHEKGECPPCVELIDKECSGQHQLVKVPCCATQISCGNSCDKPLGCGMHKCNRVCHNGECIGSEVNLKEKGCGQNCDKVLPCKHLCNEKCHPLKLECETECQQKVKITCECKHMSEIIDCGTAKNLVESRYPELKYSASAYPPLIDCNSECRLLARNQKLAEAFNIDLVKHDLPAYSKFITNMAKRNPKFLDEVEEIFSNFLKDKTTAKYYFAPMSSEKRSFIWELSQFYNFEYSSVDKKPYKSAVIVKTQKSKLPAIRLSVVLKDSSKMKILEEKLEKIEIDEEKRNTHQPNSYYKKPSKEVLNDEEWNQDVRVDDIVIGAKPLPKLSKEVKSDNIWSNLEEE
jgi:transcriptional repressor NF-X1